MDYWKSSYQSAIRLVLHEKMRKAGFKMNLVEEYCGHYCIIDREIVWCGSMNFLGKEDAEDNLVRVADKNIVWNYWS